ncbi:MAG: CDP-diacylglycerol--glycerol-3-phosphate 3-phosphatidyltransferase [Sumerlaeia bacterium]
MTLPNKLSLSRILVIPLILATLLAPGTDPSNPLLAAISRACCLLLVVAAAITDYYDGKLARETGAISNLGKLLDPLADKLLVTAAFVAFVELQLVPSWLVIVILCREFLVTGLRTLAAVNGFVMAADRWGKHKTGWQLGAIITTITFLMTKDFLVAAGVWADPLVSRFRADLVYEWGPFLAFLVAVVLTVVSGLNYLRANWALIRDSDI